MAGSPELSAPNEMLRRGCRAVSSRAVLTAATPVAASIGAAVLRRGGNVYDAVIAAALAETVLLPPKCGLAGDVVALALTPDRAEPEALISVGQASRHLARALEERPLAATGGLSVGIPGAPAGYAALAERGCLPLAELAAPAVNLARYGFIWPGISAYLTWQSRDVLREQNPGGVVYLPGGEPAPEGTPTRLPGLGEVIEQFVDRRAALFDGPLGDAVISAVHVRGGVIERDELGAAEAQWVPAARAASEGPGLWATPGPTHGPSLLGAIDGCPAGEDQVGLVKRVEAAVERRRNTHADRSVGAGTSVVTAADTAGNAIVLVHSNSFQRYGSGIVVAPYGLVLSNRPGRGFTDDRDHPNFPAPGRRPVTTLHAWAAEASDGSLLLGATPGGENQMRWNAQTLAAVRAGETDPARLVCAPRWGRFGGRLAVEDGFAETELTALQAADEVDVVPALSLRSAQQILHVRRRATDVVAGADPRTGAAARGI